MDEFWKSFKGNLENREEPAFDDKAWLAMERKIQKDTNDDKKRGFGIWIPVLVALLLASLLGNLFQMNRTSLKNPKTKLSKNTIQIQNDTIYNSKIIYQTDTVYLTQIEQKVVYRSIPNTFSTSKTYSSIWNNAGTSDYKNSPNNENLKKSGYSLLENMVSENYRDPRKEILGSIPNYLNQTSTRDIARLKIPLLTEFDYDNSPKTVLETRKMRKKSKSLRQMVYPFRPKGFIGGISGGYYYPFQKGVSGQSGYSLGIEGDIIIDDKFRLFSGITFQSLNYTVNKMDEVLGVPLMQSPSDDFEFMSADVIQPSMQYALGLKYLLSINNNLSAYFGIGYSILSTYPYTADYNYKNSLNDAEVTLEEDINASKLILNQFIYRTGIEYNLTNKWMMELSGMYRQNLSESGINSPNILGLKTGLKYKF